MNFVHQATSRDIRFEVDRLDYCNNSAGENVALD